MNDRPLVTIITPSFNSGGYIKETIESVLAQTYSPIEFRVLDAGSTDETIDVLRSFGDRVDWEVKPDNGQSDAINRGWREAKGEIIAWLCADDLIEPNAVEIAVDVLTKRPDAAAVYGGAYELAPDGSETAQRTVPPFNLWRLINLQDFIYQPAVFFRRAAVEDVGLLDEQLHFGMDWDLLIRLGERYPLIPIQDKLARVRIYPETKTSGGGVRRLRELVRLVRRRSDSRWAPACSYYAIETLRNRLHQLVDKVPVGERVRRHVHPAIERTFISGLRLMGRGIATQWLDDCWAGPRANYLVPAAQEVRFDGEVPEDLAPLTLAVRAAGREIARGTFVGGPFEMVVRLHAHAGSGPVPLVVEANRAKVVGHDLVNRRLASYRLERIETTV